MGEWIDGIWFEEKPTDKELIEYRRSEAILEDILLELEGKRPLPSTPAPEK